MSRGFMRALAGLAVAAATIGTAAAAGAPAVPRQGWSFNGIFGTFDRAAQQRGLQVYDEVCKACHGLGLVAFRNLVNIGVSANEVAEFAAKFEVPAGPNEQGEMYVRPGVPSDRFVPPYANEQAARAANNGAYPPDLSVITKARKGGADYVYALLTSFRDTPPEGVTMMEGMYYNAYFPGHQIAMPPPLVDDGVAYADGTRATVEQMAADVTAFLAWGAEPEMEARKRLGVKVLLFLIVLTGLLYALKRRIWSDLH